ncbi:unnamed protein product [Clavelina lepadiformis]|uniref:Uncharacterized protein n=1 Tax=Clavelina lepadiformis TaxID=159417 RepID=A0ABP0G0W7_CLALP
MFVAKTAVLLIEYWEKAFRWFPLLGEYIEESEEDLPNMTVNEIKRHLIILTESLLNENLPNLQRKNNYWVQNPFKITEMPTELKAKDYESLIEIPIAIFWGNLIEQ